jgi:hypothetical protein
MNTFVRVEGHTGGPCVVNARGVIPGEPDGVPDPERDRVPAL